MNAAYRQVYIHEYDQIRIVRFTQRYDPRTMHTSSSLELLKRFRAFQGPPLGRLYPPGYNALQSGW